MSQTIQAGAAAVDISPTTSQFLYGYPHVPRMSEGTKDPLLSSALCLESEGRRIVLISNDIIYIPNTSVPRMRSEIAAQTGAAPEDILISGTHTHSAPKVTENLVGRDGPPIPPVDPEYLRFMEDSIISAAAAAAGALRPARALFTCADSTGIGTNRHDPEGPADHEVPLLVVREAEGEGLIALMLVCSMHPTVMHEDSKLVSADFPGYTRAYLQDQVTGPDCVILHHTGCAGNQSPRHVTKANTFEEADRIGRILGQAVERALPGAQPLPVPVRLATAGAKVDPPRKSFPPVEQAEKELREARARFEELTRTGPRTEARTAECDVFGAEHRFRIASVAAKEGLEKAYAQCTPAEIQVVRIGDRCFAGWPGEWYVEYALKLKAACPGAYVISCANGRMPGYITTPEAEEERHYEAGASLFEPAAGDLFADTTIDLVRKLMG